MSAHGTTVRYNQGCRCSECRRANAEYKRGLNATRRRRCDGLVDVDRDILGDLLNEVFPLGLTADCPARRT